MDEGKIAAKSDKILQSLIASQEIDGELYSSDEDFDLPFGEESALEDFDEEDIQRQINQAKNLFHEITGSIKNDEKEEEDKIVDDDDEVEMTDAEILQSIPSKLELNLKMRDHILCLKEMLLLKEKTLKDKLDQLQQEESELIVTQPALKEDKNKVIVEGNPFSSRIKENYVIFNGNVGFFFSQFVAPYFKDKDYFPCPPNAHTIKLKNSHPRVLDILPSKPWSTSSLECLEKTLKKCLIDDYKNLPHFNSIFRWKEFSDYVKSHTIGDILKNREYKFDWLKVAAMLPDREKRSDCECEKMWNLYLCPRFSKDEWTAREDEQILELAGKYGEQHWNKIAEELGGSRSPYHTFIHYMKSIRPAKFLGLKWTQTEDETLKNVVMKSSYGNYIAWKKVCYYFEDRVYCQLYNRYHNSLSVQKKGKFSLDEDKALITAVLKHGLDYRDAKRLLGNKRSYHQIRSRVENVKKVIEPKIKFGMFTEKEDRELLRLVELKGPNFSEIAKHFGTRDRTQLRHRYNKLKVGFPLVRKSKGGIKKSSLKRNKLLLSFYNQTMEKNKNKKQPQTRNKVKWLRKMQIKLNKEDPGEEENEIDVSRDPLVRYLNKAGSNIWPNNLKSYTDSESKLLSTAICTLLECEFNYSDINFEDALNDENFEPIRELLKHFQALEICPSEATDDAEDSLTSPIPGTSSQVPVRKLDELKITYSKADSSDCRSSTSFGSISNNLPLIPPNVSTVKGFLNLLSFCSEQTKIVCPPHSKPTVTARSEGSNAEIKWKKRLLQLFLWPAIASKNNQSLDLSLYRSSI